MHKVIQAIKSNVFHKPDGGGWIEDRTSMEKMQHAAMLGNGKTATEPPQSSSVATREKPPVLQRVTTLTH